jgi:PIN domain nuclease of toxin-antitoxin system
MRVLLDTHAWLWFALGDNSLSAAGRAAIEDPGNEKFISPASYWELAIKISLGKFALTSAYDDFIQHAIDDQGFTILPVQPRHTSTLCSLPFHHRDPFDRLLVPGAQREPDLGQRGSCAGSLWNSAGVELTAGMIRRRQGSHFFHLGF